MILQTILKEFDGHNFYPHRLVFTFPINLEGKKFFVQDEVVNAPIGYNFFLGCTWFYETKVVASLVFHLMCFSHLGKIVTID